MSITKYCKTEINDSIKAMLIWKNLEMTEENINSLNKKDTLCIFRAFPSFTIIRNKKNIHKYREKYNNKTNKDWQLATLNDILKAELVWN